MKLLSNKKIIQIDSDRKLVTINHFLKLKLKKHIVGVIVVLGCLFGNNWNATAQTVQIGSGTSTGTYIPIYSYFGYSYSQTIYQSAELSTAGLLPGSIIDKIRYNQSSAVGPNSNGWTIYMSNTSKSSFTSNTNWETIGNLTQVFTGTVTFQSSSGWVEITLDNPFTYTGGNLLIAVDENIASYGSSGSHWYSYTSTTSNSGIYYYSDSDNPNPSSPPTADGRTSTLPQMQFDYTPPTPCAGTPNTPTITLSPTSDNPGSTFSASASGASIGTGITYQWQKGPSSTGPWTDIPGATTTNASLTAENTLGTYYYRLKTTCTNGNTSSFSSEKPFVTQITYCSPTTSSGSTYYISNFKTTGGIQNINNNSTGNTNGYQDFTSKIVSATSGTTINYTITTAGESTYGQGVWIDWNQNGTFESSEQLESTGYASSPFSSSFTIPLSATSGQYRMRILSTFTPSYPTDPCSNSGSGEYEDYTVEVIQSPDYRDEITNFDAGSTKWCASETRTVNIDVKNIGNHTWSGENVKLVYRWDSGAWQNGPTLNNTVNVNSTTSVSITAPSSGTHTLEFDLRKNTTNFSSNTGGVGPGNNIFNAGTFDFNPPTANAGSDATIYCGESIEIGVISSWNSGYCAVTSTSTTNGISNFTTTGGTTNINNTTTGGSYNDYSSLFVSQTAGNTIDFSITAANGTTGMAIWIDWNQDGIFDDATEKVYNSGSYISTGTGTITVPISTPDGDYRMRVVANWLSANPTACGDLGYQAYGEAEDYTFRVGNGSTNASYSWSPTTNLSDASISNPVATPLTTTTYTLSVNDGCTIATDQVTVTMDIGYSVNAGMDKTICEGSSVQLDGSSASSGIAPPINTTIYSTDFNGSSLAALGWGSTTDGSDNFTINYSNNAGGTSPELYFSGNDFNYMTATAYSPQINAMNYSNLVLNFNTYLWHFSSSYPYSVFVETTTGTNPATATWTTIASVDPVTADIPIGVQTINLSALDGQKFYVRFRITGETFGLFYWYIDDFQITGSASAGPTPTLTTTWIGSPIQSGANTLTPTVNPTSSTDYVLKGEVIGGCYVSDTVQVTVNPLPSTPTLSFTPNTDICRGTNITYTTETGMNNYNWSIPGTAGTDYTKVSGGTSSDDNVVIAWNAAGSGTNIGVNYVDPNGCAPASSGTASAISLPAHNNTLSANNDHATCHINGTNPVHFYDPANGHYIGSINPQGNDGVVTMTSYVNALSTDYTMYACDHPGEQFRTAFMKRSFTVKEDVTVTGGNTMKVYFPFTNAEFSNLQSNAITNTPQNSADNVGVIGDLAVTKHHNPGSENNTPYDNCSGGNSIVIANNGSAATLTSLNLPSAVTANYASFPVDDFSEFYLHGLNNSSPLPIELASFNATCNEGVELTWITASEQNVSHFEIQRSRDGQVWEVVSTVEAAGNSSTTNTYHTTDINGLDLAYYRLRSVDNNGEAQIYGPISIACENNINTWNIYPIPVQTSATVMINSNEEAQATLLINDVNGRTIFSESIQILEGSNLYDLDLRRFSEGTYTILLHGANEDLKPLKFVKMN